MYKILIILLIILIFPLAYSADHIVFGEVENGENLAVIGYVDKTETVQDIVGEKGESETNGTYVFYLDAINWEAGDVLKIEVLDNGDILGKTFLVLNNQESQKAEKIVIDKESNADKPVIAQESEDAEPLLISQEPVDTVLTSENVDESVSKEQVNDEPVSDEPVSDEPVSEESVSEEPESEEPILISQDQSINTENKIFNTKSLGQEFKNNYIYLIVIIILVILTLSFAFKRKPMDSNDVYARDFLRSNK